jgi:hypothetical protein
MDKNWLKGLIGFCPSLRGKRGKTKKITKKLEHLGEFVKLPLGKNCTYTQEDYLFSAILAAVSNKTFEGSAGQFLVSKGIRHVLPSADEQLYQIAKLSQGDIAAMFEGSRDSFLAIADPHLKGRRFFVAIDYSADPFYGCIVDNDYIVGGKEKKGRMRTTVQFSPFSSLSPT